MQEYVKMLKHCFDFNGRARRREYWVVNMINSGIAVLINALMFFICTATGNPLFTQINGVPTMNTMGNTVTMLFSILSSLFSIYVFVASLGLIVRRYHDAGFPGWAFPLCLLGTCLCGIGGIVHLVFTCLPSKEDNEYGVNPKAPENNEYDSNTSIWGSVVFYIVCMVLLMIGVFANIAKFGISEQSAFNTFTQVVGGLTGCM